VMITPHGGKLVNRIVPQQELAEARREAQSLAKLPIDASTASDVRNIAHGVFSPLEGFVNSQDFAAIIQSNKLTSGVTWTIPIILDISERDSISEGQTVCLVEEGRSDPLAILKVEDVYCWDKQAAAGAIFGTTDTQHPGVRRLHERTIWWGEISGCLTTTRVHTRSSIFHQPRRELSSRSAAGRPSVPSKRATSPIAATKSCKRQCWAWLTACLSNR